MSGLMKCFVFFGEYEQLAENVVEYYYDYVGDYLSYRGSVQRESECFKIKLTAFEQIDCHEHKNLVKNSGGKPCCGKSRKFP